MKIYFAASVSGKKYYLENYKKIVEVLRKLGHKVIYPKTFFDTDFTHKQAVLNMEKRVKIEKLHKQIARDKLRSDLVVIEGSYKSFALGQEINYALRVGKPVLVLYLQNKPHILLNEAGDRVLISQYNLENLEEVIRDAIDYLKIDEMKRFTMLVPGKIIDHLDRFCREKEISKSEYIRKLIIDDLERRV
jgi:hypothetical protein